MKLLLNKLYAHTQLFNVIKYFCPVGGAVDRTTEFRLLLCRRRAGFDYVETIWTYYMCCKISKPI